MSVIVPEISHEIVRQEPERQCLVGSCTECCRETMPDGSPNVVGALHRDSLRAFWDPKVVRCGDCPVHLATLTAQAVDADGSKLYIDGRPLTEWELIKMEMDGCD